ncbi:HPP family protein [Leucobacter soli]|uniref:HPP family protein n=1 Tax=Leucobacter soli TaxID=2812850 RepID=A0A916K2I5_9MICO|nr:HPP family protein [Leucobacter soli]CAG7616941.1 hypothetical protein LEUCIP111803_02044 [Leucobacter soli]
MSKPSDQPTPGARRKQVLLGLAVGAVVGAGIGWLSESWWAVLVGLTLGLATGLIMKPPAA